MPDKTSWIVIAPQTSNVGPAEVRDEATAFAIEIVEASKRYEPSNRLGFFATLIADLEIARQQVEKSSQDEHSQ